jgi:Domain of unknown function (DUF4422)
MANRRLLFFVATHKDGPLPMKSDIFAALGLGGYRPTTSLKAFSDDSGNSISHKNIHYSELTGWYWIWKNVSNLDIVGLCHYRRYFFLYPKHPLFSARKFYLEPSPANLATISAMVTSIFVEQALSTADVIVPRPLRLSRSIAENYVMAHRREDWDLFIESIHDMFPNLCSDVSWFDRNLYLYPYNMMIARKPFFDSYMSMLFALTGWIERKNPFPTDDPYQCRVPAFLAERFFTLYLHATGARVCEVPVATTDPTAF